MTAMDNQNGSIDAGLQSLDHYKLRLPRWRYRVRRRLLPILRQEAPYLARLQAWMRTPTLDSYFALTASLGTHTFFMITLPILFWCGYPSLGRAMVHILALGVFSSGFIKDLLCLPRPLSPPLHRITLSKSAALEYGFPSTHSTNAVSVAVYALLLLRSDSSLSRPLNLTLQTISCFYALSIVFGRLYCGMHGFSDVVVGGLLGALISCVQYIYGDAFDMHVQSASLTEAAAILLIILILVRLHPVPVDNCPCFDDSVAFAGTVLGAEYGSWQFIGTTSASKKISLDRAPFDLVSVGWPATACRIVLGVIIIFLWRGLMKTAMLRGLPPIFRVIEKFGLTLPRKFFKQASEYSKIPKLRKDDNVIPAFSEIPSFLYSVRHPRKRAISIGPQSEADAYETLAYRENRRRESISMDTRLGSSAQYSTGGNAAPMGVSNGSIPSANGRPASGDFDGPGLDDRIREKSEAPINNPKSQDQPPELKDEDVFLGIEKPRVRYDVEVVTKLVVYSGIAWLAVEGNLALFDVVGLGPNGLD